MVRTFRLFKESAHIFQIDIETVVALIAANSEFLQTMSDCVDRYLDQCGRRWVELSGLFSFMKV